MHAAPPFMLRLVFTSLLVGGGALFALLGLVLWLVNTGPSRFMRVYRAEVEKRLTSIPASQLVRPEDLDSLPPVVRRYLKLVGVVGRERVHNFRARLRGEIRPTPRTGFMSFRAEQYNFFGDFARLFFLQSARFGVPFDALHLYLGSEATMEVRAGSLFSIVDARGPRMNQSETVTLLNDLCVFAPAALIDADISWRELDERTVEATFSNRGNRVSARLHFNDAGELTNFVSDDRFLSSDGKTYTQFRWSTPLGNYRTFVGARLASWGEASWHLPTGEFVYARINIESVEYNVRTFDR